MLRRRLFQALLPLAVVAVAAALVWCSALQESAATKAAARIDLSTSLLTGMLDQETGVRGFLLNGDDLFLSPYRVGNALAATDRAKLRETADGDRQTLDLLDSHERGHTRWRAMAAEQIRLKRGDPKYAGDTSEARERKTLMDQIRLTNRELHDRLEQRRAEDVRAASRLSTTVILLLVGMLGAAGLLLQLAEARRRHAEQAVEQGYRASQREFTDVIQVVGSEPEAHTLLKRHLDMQLPAATTTVLSRNNSDNRLEASTPPSPGSPLAERLQDAEPASCLAIRLGRPHRELEGTERLLHCPLCGDAASATACTPLLVGGQVIGSVLVEHHGPLEAADERRITESVSQAAPVLANLRNLALAERRAATDALTGLPNRRAIQDTLKRMSAQAARNGQPLAAIAFDLDRFKDINDRFGHEMGDTVLAHVASLMTATLRVSDFCGRQGGEEFLILAPNTGVDGAATLAENLRAALEREPVAGLDRDVTASFGVAVIPDHAADADTLLRLADRALYTAKAAGRNRTAVAQCESSTAAGGRASSASDVIARLPRAAVSSTSVASSIERA